MTYRCSCKLQATFRITQETRSQGKIWFCRKSFACCCACPVVTLFTAHLGQYHEQLTWRRVGGETQGTLERLHLSGLLGQIGCPTAGVAESCWFKERLGCSWSPTPHECMQLEISYVFTILYIDRIACCNTRVYCVLRK